MEKPELLLMSQRERDRLRVLRGVEKGHLGQRQAAAPLGLTDRWVRELLARLRPAGSGPFPRADCREKDCNAPLLYLNDNVPFGPR